MEYATYVYAEDCFPSISNMVGIADNPISDMATELKRGGPLTEEWETSLIRGWQVKMVRNNGEPVIKTPVFGIHVTASIA